MSEIYMLMTVTKRTMGRKLLACYEENGLAAVMCTLARGTATSDILDYFGLEVTEKMVTMTVVSDETWKKVKHDLEDKLQIDVPGTGIAFLVPVSSVGGKKVFQFLTDADKPDGYGLFAQAKARCNVGIGVAEPVPPQKNHAVFVVQCIKKGLYAVCQFLRFQLLFHSAGRGQAGFQFLHSNGIAAAPAGCCLVTVAVER